MMLNSIVLLLLLFIAILLSLKIRNSDCDIHGILLQPEKHSSTVNTGFYSAFIL